MLTHHRFASVPDPTRWILVSWARKYHGYKCYGYYRNNKTDQVHRFVFHGASWGAYFETIQTPSSNNQ